MLSYNDSLTVLCSSDLQYVSVEDMYSIQCSSSYALLLVVVFEGIGDLCTVV